MHLVLATSHNQGGMLQRSGDDDISQLLPSLKCTDALCRAVTSEGEASGFASSLRALSIAYLCTIGTKFMDDFAHSSECSFRLSIF